MDLSGIIFVVVALGWGAYLLPMAVRRHEHGTDHRLGEELSGQHRVIGRADAIPATLPAVAPDPAAIPSRTDIRQAGRRAARRRRVVLGLLVLALGAVAGTSYFGLTQWWSTAVPGALIVVFLVVARVTVRRERARRRAVLAGEPADQPAIPVAPPVSRDDDTPADEEGTTSVSYDDLAVAVAGPDASEGGLWDPVPMTLPTYVTKARAHRTVRTIELTGVTSSGHDAADTALAREAATTATERPVAERKVAGA